MPTEIRCRYTTGTYVATVKGQKKTASNTISARQAAEAMATKLGLDPAHLVEQQRDLIDPKDRVVFIHPGEPATNTSDKAHCPNCGICHTREETCIEARQRVGVGE